MMNRFQQAQVYSTLKEAVISDEEREKREMSSRVVDVIRDDLISFCFVLNLVRHFRLR